MKLARFLSHSPDLAIDVGLLALRTWFGLVLAFGHGLGKMTDLAKFTANVASKEIPLPGITAPAAALSEFVGGIFLALGLATRPSALSIVITMLVAAFVVHARDPFAKQEFALAYAVAALVVLIAGPGRFSLDARLFGRRATG